MSRIPISAIALALATTWPSSSLAASKDECLDAHARGQDARERGQLTRARQLFVTCAQSSCPPLVQADCARFGDELGHLIPTVTFGARDATAADLPSTTVYVDDVMVTSRLDDGRAYELDPGKHVVRYVHDGKETSLRVVLGQGEKGRLLLATFSASGAISPTDGPSLAAPRRSALPLVVAGLGAAAAATGGVLVGVGMAKVPGNCSVSTKECAGPPGDPSLERATSGVSMANLGLTVGISGALALASGLAWYFLQPPASPAHRGRAPFGVLTF